MSGGFGLLLRSAEPLAVAMIRPSFARSASDINALVPQRIDDDAVRLDVARIRDLHLGDELELHRVRFLAGREPVVLVDVRERAVDGDVPTLAVILRRFVGRGGAA